MSCYGPHVYAYLLGFIRSYNKFCNKALFPPYRVKRSLFGINWLGSGQIIRT